MYGSFCDRIKKCFSFVHDSLWLYVSFEDGGLKLGLIGASYVGPFGEGEVHVRPLCKILQFLKMGLQVLDVVRQQ